MRFGCCWDGCDQRFADHDEEREFRLSLERQLLQRSSVFCFLSCLISILYLFWLLAREMSRAENPFRFADAPRTIVVATLVNSAVLSVLLLGLIRFHLCVGILKWNWEDVIVVWCTYLSTSNAVLPMRVALMFGEDPLHTFGYDASHDAATELLLMVCILTAVSVYLPIRSCKMWIPGILGLLVSMGMETCFPVATGRADDYVLVIVMLYSVLHGARDHESNARQRWLATRTVAKQEGFLDSQHKAVCTLLSMLCDCLVQLGPNLEVLESTRLAAVLFYTREEALVGRRLTDFLAEDQQVAVESIKAVVPERSEMLPLRLKDVNGSELRTHAYFTRFDSTEGPCFYVGFVEHQGRAIVDTFPDTFPESAAAPRAPFIINTAVDGSCMTSDNRSQSGSEGGLSVVECEDIRVSCSLQPGLPILGYSPAFGSLAGPVVDDGGFAGMLHPDNVVDFQTWLGETMGSYFVDLPYFYLLKLRMPSTSGSGLEHSVGRTRISVMGESDDGNLMVQLRLQDVRRRKAKRRTRALDTEAGSERASQTIQL